ncbi:carboxylesterase [Leifsonia sp. Root227]|uniref:carboxylesterase/lipase family protein n=1 Tax=Leifsonia sp. Root227 TaxID=1736496 RepID=UPI0006FA3CB9|nr:carboxylesterase family protein [Leifsonia sp. Root227]KRC50610.1 carboxylesterase [Leifsonia sp. Root227]
MSTTQTTLPTAPEADTTAGRVRGLWRDGSAAFLGIPFAEAPTGDLRFAAPVAHAPWDGVRDTTAYGATPQRAALSEITLIPEPSYPGESTLNVNVFTPAPGDRHARLPVLVYIHGGGFIAGSPASPWYDGAAFNRDGVVTVSVSYRLGFDGFGWIEDAPQNRGILDWLLALEWVRDNIAAFGGDPALVTIAGQSAGGGAVLTLLAVPRASGLFQRAISISGATSDLPVAEAETYGRRLAELGGVPPTRAGLSSLDEATVLGLQAQLASPAPEPGAEEDPLAGLVQLASGGLVWGPVVDGELLPQSVADAIRSGVGADKELVLGATDNEFNMALTAQRDALAAVPAAAVLGRFGLAEETVAAYVDANAGRDTADILGQYITDRMFRTTALTLAAERAETGAPTWLYRFAWPSPTIGGACHCLDMPFFFDCLAAERVEYIAGANPPQSLADDVHGAAVSFIADGDPGWTPFDTSSEAARVFDVPSRTAERAYADVEVLLPAAVR